MTSEPTDLHVGTRRIRWWNNPTHCTHTGPNVCTNCTELTNDEAYALHQYLKLLFNGKAER